MKPDPYTKAVLTVIAVMLSVIVAIQLAKPVPGVAAAPEQTQFAVGPDANFYFYSAGTNVIKRYGPGGDSFGDIHLH
jgi:hypothetical protein